ncbi:MAG TPA: ParA family protein [Anaerolineales bacterium]|nr:ParA family protein [Anaerolineales bacterium]
MTYSIVIANQKGGVGKTTTAVTLAHGLALRDRRVLLVDFDPQGQCATSLALNPEPGVFHALINPSAEIGQWIRNTTRASLDLLPGDRSTSTAQIVINAENHPITLIHLLFMPLAKDYDYIIFDTAPSVGGIQERAIYAADVVLIPTATEFLPMDGLAQMMELLAILKAKWHWPGKLLGILPTFYDEQTRESHKSLADLQADFSDSILKPIHRATVLRECAAEGQTIFELLPASRAACEYGELTDEVLKRL